MTRLGARGDVASRERFRFHWDQTPEGLVKILPSKRGHLYVLERARVMVRNERVEYISDEGREPRAFNIPVANTIFLLLGPGASITQEAVRRLKQEGVGLGFCGSGGVPLLAADEPYPDLIMPMDEYRDPTFLHRWIEVWRVPAARLAAARDMMHQRIERIGELWPQLDLDRDAPRPPRRRDLRSTAARIDAAEDVTQLLAAESNLTKMLYQLAGRTTGFADFTRAPQTADDVSDPNRLLDHGNYLAYGLAQCVLWVLGIPPGFAMMHGKTRRGALVFDLADTIKDAMILPAAFTTAAQARDGAEVSDTDFRASCIRLFDDHAAMDKLFESMRRTCAAGEAALNAAGPRG